MTKKKKKSINSKVDTDVWTEEEYDKYMAGIYGFKYIAGYTDSGIPFGISEHETSIDTDEIEKNVNDLDDEIPF